MAEGTNLFQKFGHSAEPGTIIFKEGEEGDQMYIIRSGRVKVTRNIGGQELTLAILEKSDFFGEMAIINLVKRTATVTAIDRVEMLAFNRQGFLSMINKNAQIALNVIDKLCRRLQNANLQIHQLAKRNAQGMVALNLRHAFQGAASQGGSLLFDRTVEDIARGIELSMEEVRKYLEEFKSAGFILLESNTLRLLDSEKLDQIAENVGH